MLVERMPQLQAHRDVRKPGTTDGYAKHCRGLLVAQAFEFGLQQHSSLEQCQQTELRQDACVRVGGRNGRALRRATRTLVAGGAAQPLNCAIGTTLSLTRRRRGERCLCALQPFPIVLPRVARPVFGIVRDFGI